MDKFQFTQIFKDTTTGIIREARKISLLYYCSYKTRTIFSKNYLAFRTA